MHLRKLVQQLHHPVVIFQRVQPRPGQAILPRHQVFIKRLMLVPQDDNSQLRHESLISPNPSAICQFNALGKFCSAESASSNHFVYLRAPWWQRFLQTEPQSLPEGMIM